LTTRVLPKGPQHCIIAGPIIGHRGAPHQGRRLSECAGNCRWLSTLSLAFGHTPESSLHDITLDASAAKRRIEAALRGQTANTSISSTRILKTFPGGVVHKTVTSWLIYHPKREYRSFDGQPVYFDKTEGNQDPYIWSDRFLHSYCHITQFRAEIGGIHLWVSGDTFPQFRHLYCDLVFVVADKQPWKEPNRITRSDPIVESKEAFKDHY
jgi:hypothetical protein